MARRSGHPVRRERARAGATARQAQPATPSSQPASGEQKPEFRVGTERIVIDAAVVDKNGAPVTGLTAVDFTLTIDGTPRRVLSAELVAQSATDDPSTPAAPQRRLTYSTNQHAVGGRLVLLVFDLEGIGTGGGRDAAKAAADFVQRLSPGDQVGVLALPNGISVEFTSDRERVSAALQKIVGRGTQLPLSTYTDWRSGSLRHRRRQHLRARTRARS